MGVRRERDVCVSVPVILLIPVSLVISAGLAGSVNAQVVGKVPVQPPAATEYVPAVAPPPAVAVPAKPPEPEPALSLISKDQGGKIIALESPAEYAAVLAYPFDAERKARVIAVMNLRKQEQERFVIENLSAVGAAHKAKVGMEGMTDFGALNTAREAAKALRQESVLDRLQREGAIGGPQRATLEKAVREYAEARSAELSTQTGADVMKIASIVGQQGFKDLTWEVFEALDRLNTRCVRVLRTGGHGLTLSDEQKGAMDATLAVLADETREAVRTSVEQGGGVDQSSRPKSKAALRAFVLDTLTPEQGKALLELAAPKKSEAKATAPTTSPAANPAVGGDGAPSDKK